MKSEVIYLDAAKNLWKNFEAMTDLSYVLRKGFEVCGVYTINKGGSVRIFSELEKLTRPESTAEHSARVANLLSEIMLWYPQYFAGVDRFLVLKTALNHDVGEIEVGDVIDDGGRAHDLKADAEWAAVKAFYNNLPADDRERMLDYHRQFEDANTLLGQMIKMADKVDAIGKLILFEKRGLYGDIFHKDPPSERDVNFAREIGTGNCTDVWGRHLEWLFDTNDFRQSVVDIAKGFLSEGLQSIGRDFFPWWST